MGDGAQLLMGARALFRRNLVNQDVQSLDIPPRLDRHDALAADPVGQEVPSSREEKGLGRMGPRFSCRLVHSDVGLLAQVMDFIPIGPHAAQVPHERILVGEDLARKPGLQRLIHWLRHYSYLTW